MSEIRFEPTAEIPSENDLGKLFNEMDSADFIRHIRTLARENPNNLVIIASWGGVQKARFAKALLDDRQRYHIESITILCTPEQYQEDVNAFQSGVIAIDSVTGKRLNR